jgi:hypothetical protein
MRRLEKHPGKERLPGLAPVDELQHIGDVLAVLLPAGQLAFHLVQLRLRHLAEDGAVEFRVGKRSAAVERHLVALRLQDVDHRRAAVVLEKLFPVAAGHAGHHAEHADAGAVAAAVMQLEVLRLRGEG